ncbi:MAG: GGDEF domain-containing protein [Stenotrophobium sp.]
MRDQDLSMPFPSAHEAMGDLAPARNANLLSNDPARYSELVRNISAYGIYLVDADGLILSWNRGAASITNYAEREVLGQPYSLLFPEAALNEGLPQKNLTFARSNGHSHEEQIRRKRSGEEFIGQCTLDAIRADDGSITGFVEVLQDISEQKRRENQLYQRATRDALTGVFNRGHFTEMATLEIDRARRFGEPLSAIMLDIDHFKKVNDTYGHPVGDQVIIALAQTLTAQIRNIDFVGRLGGEEFAILLPRANKEPAAEVAQRLRLLVSEQRVPIAPEREIGFTVSIGVAALRPTTRNLQELLRNADAALYTAKREGRNRVEIWFE